MFTTQAGHVSSATVLSWRAWLTRGADRALGLAALEQLYLASARRPEPDFVDRALGVLGVRCDAAGDMAGIPSHGALVIEANHPHGALDGLAVLSVALRRRRDVKVLGNHLLAAVPELRDVLVPVDVRGGPRAAIANARALRTALRWVRQGGCLCVFPSGEVAHGGWRATAVESAWSDSVARLARQAGASTVRLAIDGSNGRLFRLAGVLHPSLRTALLPRMLLHQRGQRVVVRVGDAMSGGARPAPVCRRAADDTGQPLAAATSIRAMDPVDREVMPLLERQLLARQGALAVFWAHGEHVPALLQRLGRAREDAFRAAGEGSGNDVDLDAFDATYLHLCLWDRERHCLAGAYRMGLADQDDRARSALYTSTLFGYDQRWFDTLGPSIELGRAFLAAPYQRQFAPLALLWSAIGRFVAEHPRYRCLFGAVSIDTAYGPVARHAMVTYLQQHAGAPNLSQLVAPRHPLTTDHLADERLAWAGTFPRPDVGVLDGVVSRLDARGRGVPVLLRQYLKLDARAVAFSVDPAFSNVLDALVVVDLPAAPMPMLRRFMGAASADCYVSHHGRTDEGRQVPRRRA